MDNYHRHPHPLKKYVPNSPSSSPHNYQQDSFQAEQLSRQLPNPTYEMNNNNYELTFKKDMQQQYFVRDPKIKVNKLLFNTTENSLVNCLRLPLNQYFNKTLQELTNLPFADLMSLELEDFLREKLNLVGQILQVKRMRMKLSSVSINIKCLKIKQNQNYQDKNRIFLLQLLQKQLRKKLFLQALKLNQMHNSFIRQFASKQQNFIHNTPQDTQNHEVNEQPFIETSQRQPPSYYSLSKNQEENDENMQQKMMILIHGITLIKQKLLFYSFNKISKYIPYDEPSNYMKNISYNEFQSIPLISRPNFMDQSYPKQQKKEHKDQDIRQAEISQSRLEELYSYIQALHEQCAQTNNILKKYFIKWKINLLQSIADSILNQMRPNSMNYAYQQQQEHKQQSSQLQQQQRQHSQVFRESRQTSQLSQVENSLKNQKKCLKQFLIKNKMKTFITLLRDYSELRKISLICVQMFRQNAMRKSFFALKQNVKEENLQRQMQVYYKQISENQLQDDGTSKLFYKTNLLFYSFKRIKQNFRASKMLKAIQNGVLKIIFRQIVSYCIQLRRYNQVTQRRLQYCRNNLMFKYFNYWKQTHLNQHSSNHRIKTFLQIKQKQTLQYYFSLLKLQFKRGLLKSRKASHIYQNNLKGKTFFALKEVYEENRSMQQRTDSLRSYLLFSKGCIFMHSFKQYYQDYIQYQRFSIKQQKLRRTLIKLHALESIKRWRKNQIKKHAYQAIQMKLVRLKNKQRKRQILSLWHQKALNVLHRSGSSNKSEKHKDWLVKYYGNLCSVLPS